MDQETAEVHTAPDHQEARECTTLCTLSYAAAGWAGGDSGGRRAPRASEGKAGDVVGRCLTGA